MKCCKLATIRIGYHKTHLQEVPNDGQTGEASSEHGVLAGRGRRETAAAREEVAHASVQLRLRGDAGECDDRGGGCHRTAPSYRPLNRLISIVSPNAKRLHHTFHSSGPAAVGRGLPNKNYYDKKRNTFFILPKYLLYPV